MAQYVKHKPALAGPDYIHFTFTGAQEIGSDLAKSLTTYYDFYKLRQGLPDDSISEFIHKDRKLIEEERAMKKKAFKPMNYYYE